MKKLTPKKITQIRHSLLLTIENLGSISLRLREIEDALAGGGMLTREDHEDVYLWLCSASDILATAARDLHGRRGV